MKVSNDLLHYLRNAVAFSQRPRPVRFSPNPYRTHLQTSGPRQVFQRRNASSNPADDPNFVGLADRPARYIHVNQKKGGALLYLLAAMPITAFALGCWQVQRLGWKTELIARFEDRLVREPLPLPPTVDPSVVKDFDYRRVYVTGKYRHDQEMLVGPRIFDGEDGFWVFTPLERKDGCKVLVNRGWISKSKQHQWDRLQGLPTGEVTVSGLLREPFKKNMFTPDNKPELREFYFPDIPQMAAWTGSEPVFIEATMQPDLYVLMDRQAKGIPVGRPAEVNLRNNHAQYVFTWFSLSLATSVMFFMLTKRPPRGVLPRSDRW